MHSDGSHTIKYVYFINLWIYTINLSADDIPMNSMDAELECNIQLSKSVDRYDEHEFRKIWWINLILQRYAN